MQEYILTKPNHGSARLHLGIWDDLPEPWQPLAKRLVARRQFRLTQRSHAKHGRISVCDRSHSFKKESGVK